jgi:hypothetical protein
MRSKTSNVKLGVCKVVFGGVDLGFTQGGVEVSVSSETHKVQIDQFGKTPIAETIMGRSVAAKVPLAETTIEHLSLVMPGATIVVVGGARASGTVTIATNPAANSTIVINGVTITFVASGAVAANSQVLIGATAAATATNLGAFLNETAIGGLGVVTATVATTVVTITYRWHGTDGNTVTLAAGTSGATVSGATLTGGSEPTSKRVDVTDGVEQPNLLSIAKELRLHPVTRPDSDRSEDFVIPLAATAGGLQFAYKLEEERVYNVEFQGYPDSTTRRLFYVGF